MRDLLGVQMSEGTVCELIKRCAGQLAPVEQQITAALKQAEVIHQDEVVLQKSWEGCHGREGSPSCSA